LNRWASSVSFWLIGFPNKLLKEPSFFVWDDSGWPNPTPGVQTGFSRSVIVFYTFSKDDDPTRSQRARQRLFNDESATRFLRQD
jgi:hypothetical protein